MKEIIKISIVMLVFFCLLIPAAADEAVKEASRVVSSEDAEQYFIDDNILLNKRVAETQTLVLREYDFMKEVSTKQELIDFERTYISYLQTLNSTYTDEELSNMGYDDNQIELLRDFVATPENLSALSAELTFTYDAIDFWGTVTTIIQIDFEFEWDVQPAYLGTDMLGFAWNSKNASRDFNRRPSGSYFWIGLYNGTDFSWSQSQSWVPVNKNGTTEGEYIKFETSSGSSYVKAGDGRFMIEYNKTVPANTIVEVYPTYAHHTSSGIYVVSLNNSGFTFSPNLVDVYTDTHYATFA